MGSSSWKKMIKKLQENNVSTFIALINRVENCLGKFFRHVLVKVFLSLIDAGLITLYAMFV